MKPVKFLPRWLSKKVLDVLRIECVSANKFFIKASDAS